MFRMLRQTISGQLFWMRLARRQQIHGHCCVPAEPQVIDFVDPSDYVFTLVCRFAMCYHPASQEHVSGVHRLLLLLMQAPKIRTLATTIYRYRNLDLAVTIAKIVQNVFETTKN